jgi:NADPH:quinone reductase-like Zn-dependent oxidoreductase
LEIVHEHDGLREIKKPLVLEERPSHRPGYGEVLVRVEACAVCRTDLHVVDGELPSRKPPIVTVHEIVGIVEALRSATIRFSLLFSSSSSFSRRISLGSRPSYFFFQLK